MALLMIVLLFPIAVISSEETTAAQFGNMIDEIYNFQPSTWTDELRQAKIKEMDKFWDLVKSNPQQYIGLLRKELHDQGNNPFFFIDRAMLLLEISSVKPDMLLAVDAMSRANLEDLDQPTYLHQVHELAWPRTRSGWGQDGSALFCTLNMDDDRYVDRFAQRRKTETNPVTIKTIIVSLAYAASPEGQKAIRDFATACEDSALKAYAVEFYTFEDKRQLPKKKVKSKREYFDRFLDDLANGEYNPSGYNWNRCFKEACYLVQKKTTRISRKCAGTRPAGSATRRWTR